ncbi:DotU family type IV/VI secretion system protein [Burkholderia pseudomultivorans]|uniref:DotU family type IV/VI secretion system protein n=1 Tax=Burkholderia pseudomultivorans TaxID=1207504 RepID=UPI00189049A3|nr:DotU family type IV/VI secretion system protein [Burkholderia pseudomultivorans]MBF5014510.1 DotU family type IV/VI secretion system protein [Burkholderia pseudomultivorans]
MNALTSSRPERALPDSLTGADSTPSHGMRDLLRDTALLVTTLGTGGTTKDADELRNRCRQLIEHFSEALKRRGYPDDVRREALIAQCGLLDETVLRALPAEMRAGWELKPLQVEQFNLHDAGESVFDRLEARMRETPPRVDLLECYAAILGMGFVGRYARESEVKRSALIARLNTQLESLRPSSARPFVIDRAGRRLSDWFYRLSPWAIAGLACVAAMIVWMLWAGALDMQIAHLAPAKGIRP